MKRLLLVTFLLGLFVADLALAGITADRVPPGEYCGDYSFGLVKGRLTTGEEPNIINIWLNSFGDEYVCNGEKYTYNPSTNVIDIHGAQDSSNCLGKLLTKAQVTLLAKYFPNEDSFYLDLGIAKITLTQCE